MVYSSCNDTQRERLSSVMQKVAGEYVQLGKTLDRRKNYLRSACSAWNIACLPLTRREHEIKAYVKEYQKINNASPNDAQAVEENLRMVIAQKDKLYPNLNVQILSSDILVVDGVENIAITSKRNE